VAVPLLSDFIPPFMPIVWAYRESTVAACTACAASRVQMTAQDVSTMMRFGAAPIIFLVNNAGYAIEIEIHDGPYNQ
jgi:hypothetical protein